METIFLILTVGPFALVGLVLLANLAANLNDDCGRITKRK